MTTSLTVITLIVTGLMVGVELCVATLVNPILDRLPGDDGLLGRADGGRIMGRLMPWWYLTSLALCVVLAVLWRDSPWMWSIVAAAALLVVSVAMSLLLLVPINNRAQTWTPETAPADWREQSRRWDRWHYVRVAVIIAGFACLALGTVAPATV